MTPSTEPVVEPGMLLVHRRGPVNGMPERFDLWAVKSVRTLRSIARVTLIAHHGYAHSEATASFPDGVVKEPFRIIQFSERDREALWKLAGGQAA